jgi:hypothetical protein
MKPMKLGKIHYIGTCLDNQDKPFDFYARKIAVPNHYILPRSVIIINGTRKPNINLVDIQSNAWNLQWNNDGCFSEFVRNNIWAFSNTNTIAKTKQYLLSCCSANNIERVGMGLDEIKYNLKLWILCKKDGEVFGDWNMYLMRLKANSTFGFFEKPNKLPKLSSYSECLPLP